MLGAELTLIAVTRLGHGEHRECHSDDNSTLLNKHFGHLAPVEGQIYFFASYSIDELGLMVSL